MHAVTIDDLKVQTLFVAGVLLLIGIAFVIYLIAFAVRRYRPQSRTYIRIWIFNIATPIPRWVELIFLGTVFLIIAIIAAGL